MSDRTPANLPFCLPMFPFNFSMLSIICSVAVCDVSIVSAAPADVTPTVNPVFRLRGPRYLKINSSAAFFARATRLPLLLAHGRKLCSHLGDCREPYWGCVEAGRAPKIAREPRRSGARSGFEPQIGRAHV